MSKELLPIYEIQDFEAQKQQDQYFYFSSFAAHLQEHLFIREPHKHDFYIILYVNQGTGTHTIDFNEYEVKPGTFFFMTPGQVHSWELSENADGFVVFFTQAFYAREYPGRMPFDIPFFNALLYNPILSISKDDEKKLIPILQKLEQEHKQSNIWRDVMLSRYLDILLIELARLYRPAEGHTGFSGNEQTILQSLEKLINKHYKQHKPVTFYADHLHVTTKHLHSICKRSLNKSTKELIQNRILLEAQRLLVHSDLTSTQIATELGYFDNTYFFRFFKKLVGLTPEQFRAAHNKQ